MKNYQIVSIIAVCILLLFIFLIGHFDFGLLLPTFPYHFKYRIIIVFLSLLLSIVGTFTFKAYLLKFVHILWMFPFFYLLQLFLINTWSFRNLDYMFAKQMNFRVEQHFENKWISNYIIIEKSDTIFYSQNLRWMYEIDEELLTKDNLKRLEVRKSRIQHYYHLKLKNK